MLKWLHPYAKSERLYQLCGRLLPWLAIPAGVLVIIGTIWGLAFTPAVAEQGNGYRIIYIHVPAAMLSMGTYLAMAIAAFIGLVWQQKHAHTLVMALAPVGAVVSFIALFTGSVWGKPMWGTWWVWDARLTSELVLFFLYIGVIALMMAYSDDRQGSRAGSLLAVVGVINLPIIHYSVVLWQTLHQGPTLFKSGRSAITPDLLYPLLICILGWAFWIAVISLIRMRNLLLEKELHRPWAQAELEK